MRAEPDVSSSTTYTSPASTLTAMALPCKLSVATTVPSPGVDVLPPQPMVRIAAATTAYPLVIDGLLKVRGQCTAWSRIGESQLAREKTAWSSVFSALLSAAVANALGDRPETLASLRVGLEAARNADLSLHAAAARHQLGLLLPGDAGREMLQQAEGEMAARGIRSPSRMANRLLPGRWGSS